VKKMNIAGLAIVGLIAAACSETSAPSSDLAITMASAFSVAPSGVSELSTSFAAAPDAGAFLPGFGPRENGHGPHDGFDGPGHGPGFGLGFMGGGLLGPFLGDGLERGFFHTDTSCTYAGGVVTCGPTTRNGLTVTRVSQYLTTAGASQSKLDSTTNTVTTKVTVTGTTTRRDSSTSTVNETSNQTVAGLAPGSTKRTVNGTSAATESSTGKSKEGAFTAKRTAGDTITGVVIPAATTTNEHPYPTAGTVIRAMAATVTITGQSPTSSSRREVITYDGSATAKVVITHDGTTQNCTMPLPHGKLTCT
jgi:hypothetical protein